VSGLIEDLCRRIIEVFYRQLNTRYHRVGDSIGGAWHMAWHDRAGHDRAGQSRAGHDMAGQHRTGQDRAGQDNGGAEQDNGAAG
jgi:hypothetical protein